MTMKRNIDALTQLYNVSHIVDYGDAYIRENTPVLAYSKQEALEIYNGMAIALKQFGWKPTTIDRVNNINPLTRFDIEAYHGILIEELYGTAFEGVFEVIRITKKYIHLTRVNDSIRRSIRKKLLKFKHLKLGQLLEINCGEIYPK